MNKQAPLASLMICTGDGGEKISRNVILLSPGNTDLYPRRREFLNLNVSTFIIKNF
jgi:hypothetical protein